MSSSYDRNKNDFHSSSSDRICHTDSITGKFETLGSNFSHEIRASEAAGVIATILRSHPIIYPFLRHMTETKKTSIVALVIESDITDSITGKFETLGSNFRHETIGLLPSACYYNRKSFKTNLLFAVKRFWIKFTHNCRTTMT